MIGISLHEPTQTERSEVVYVALSIENLLKVVAFARVVEAAGDAIAVISVNNVRLSVTPFDWRDVVDTKTASQVVRWFASHPILGGIYGWR
jgi:hypothetical protein